MFGLLFYVLFECCWDKVVCVSDNLRWIVCNICCREFEAVIYFLHHCVRVRLRAMLHLLPS